MAIVTYFKYVMELDYNKNGGACKTKCLEKLEHASNLYFFTIHIKHVEYDAYARTLRVHIFEMMLGWSPSNWIDKSRLKCMCNAKKSS